MKEGWSIISAQYNKLRGTLTPRFSHFHPIFSVSHATVEKESSSEMMPEKKKMG